MSTVFRTEAEAIKEVKFCNGSRHDLGGKEIEQGRRHCSVCNNRGYTYSHIYGTFGWYITTRTCDCAKFAIQTQNINNSGLSDLMQQYTLESFATGKIWQAEIKTKANRYLAEVLSGGRGWFLTLGQSGAGKTHLCTAICGKLIMHGFSVNYFRWGVEGKRIKEFLNTPKYSAEIDKIMRSDVIYIDDLFKRKKGAGVTDGDVKLAFELIDTALAERKILIVSGEDFTEGLTEIDTAIAGRLKQKAGQYIIELEGDDKNQRL